VRVRLQSPAAGFALLIALGAAGGEWFALAIAPYAFALFLWALFNYWEPYGRGDGRPWSAYLHIAELGTLGRRRDASTRLDDAPL